MDTTLVTVTLLSMGMAAALSVIVWRMLRDERQRTEARVLALTQRAVQAPVRHLRPAEMRVEQATRIEDRGNADLILHATPVPVAAMFAERPAASPWGNRAAVMAGLALVLASGVLVALTARDRAGAQPRPSTTARTTAGSAQPAGRAAAPGLELLSLRDSRQPASLTITGLVQNPGGGAALTGVTVTAYAFDDKGSFLASGRAPIEVTALAPGDESPFVVTVPVTEAVARYRIGFRGEDGRVIAHVDKRQQAPVAANW